MVLQITTINNFNNDWFDVLSMYILLALVLSDAEKSLVVVVDVVVVVQFTTQK